MLANKVFSPRPFSLYRDREERTRIHWRDAWLKLLTSDTYYSDASLLCRQQSVKINRLPVREQPVVKQYFHLQRSEVTHVYVQFLDWVKVVFQPGKSYVERVPLLASALTFQLYLNFRSEHVGSTFGRDNARLEIIQTPRAVIGFSERKVNFLVNRLGRHI